MFFTNNTAKAQTKLDLEIRLFGLEIWHMKSIVLSTILYPAGVVKYVI